MDAATTAAIAALAVSVLAMTVAFAQAVQQYLVTGQLLRMCDSVVYGKMPGKGRRVWEFAQFRFRIVYSIPQLSLRSSLWLQGLSHYSRYDKGHLPVPDLCHSAKDVERDFRHAIAGHAAGQLRSRYSASPGEASWVSFSRVAQHASGNDLFYEVVRGDADRCPSDLPVVPMQVSMRDVVTLALMAGMQCTEASFQQKSIAMEGSAGTITSSSHPLLGAIIHFSPRNHREAPGLRIGGSINPLWMARLWDVAVVAGRPFDLRERVYYETYEGFDWGTTSSDRTLAKFLRLAPSRRPSSLTSDLRRRRTKGFLGQSTPNLTQPPNSAASSSTYYTESSDCTSNETDAAIFTSRQDGDWSFEPEDFEMIAHINPNALDSNVQLGCENEGGESQLHSRLQRLKLQLLQWLSPKIMHHKTLDLDVEALDVKGNPTTVPQTELRPSPSQRKTDVKQRPDDASSRRSQSWGPFAKRRGRHLLDGLELQEYIEEKRVARSSLPSNRKLLLTWPIEEKQANNFESKDIDEEVVQSGDWRDVYLSIKRERVFSYIERWRAVLEHKQQALERDAFKERWPSIASTSRQLTGRRLNHSPSQRSRSRSQVERRPHSSRRRNSRGARNFSPDSVISRPRGRTIYRDQSRTNGSSYRSPGFASIPFERYQSALFSPYSPTSAQGEKEIAYGSAPIDIRRRTPARILQDSIDSQELEQDRREEEQHQSRKPTVGFRLHESDRSSTDRSLDHVKAQSAADETDTVRSDLRDESKLQKRTSHKTVGTGNSAKPISADTSQTRHVEGQRMNKFDESIPVRNDRIAEAENYQRRKGVLKAPTQRFPEHPDSIREGVAPLDSIGRIGIPKDARWTKIDRRLVNPEALTLGNERFEERPDYVVVLRVLTKEEIEKYATVTEEIRHKRHYEYQERMWELLLDSEPGRSRQHSSSSESSSNFSRRISISPPRRRRFRSPPPHTDWSNESVFGSFNDSGLSESPSRITDDGREKMAPQWANRRKKRRSSSPKIPDNFQHGNSRRRRSSASSVDFRSNGNIEYDRIRTPKPSEPKLESERSRSNRSDWRIPQVSIPQSIEPGSEHSSDDNFSWDIISDEESINITKERDRTKGSVDWFWICQIDALPGYFATPWQGFTSESACVGAIVAMLELLQYFTNESTMTFVEKQPQCESWIYQGKSTHPSYAINAMGGIIVSGKYTRTQFGSFGTRIPPLELLRSYQYQVDRAISFDDSAGTLVERLGEIMGLDSWLSFCGRLPEIRDGRNNLLCRMPSLIQKLMTDFEYEFQNLDRTANEGGLQIIKELAELILRELERQNLSDAEQLFTTIAMLRAAKMGLCVVWGPDTAKLRDIFLHDVQVYLV